MMTIENIRNQSPVLVEMEKNHEIKIIGGMYDISNGEGNLLQLVQVDLDFFKLKEAVLEKTASNSNNLVDKN